MIRGYLIASTTLRLGAVKARLRGGRCPRIQSEAYSNNLDALLVVQLQFSEARRLNCRCLTVRLTQWLPIRLMTR